MRIATKYLNDSFNQYVKKDKMSKQSAAEQLIMTFPGHVRTGKDFLSRQEEAQRTKDGISLWRRRAPDRSNVQVSSSEFYDDNDNAESQNQPPVNENLENPAQASRTPSEPNNSEKDDSESILTTAATKAPRKKVYTKERFTLLS